MNDYVSYEKAIARHDDDDWLPRHIFVDSMLVLCMDGTYNLIMWRAQGRYEFRGFKTREDAKASEITYRPMLRHMKPGLWRACYRGTRLTECVHVADPEPYRASRTTRA